MAHMYTNMSQTFWHSDLFAAVSILVILVTDEINCICLNNFQNFKIWLTGCQPPQRICFTGCHPPQRICFTGCHPPQRFGSQGVTPHKEFCLTGRHPPPQRICFTGCHPPPPTKNFVSQKRYQINLRKSHGRLI